MPPPVRVRAPSPPRNIVIITADQLARRGVGGYGNPHVNTPAIDSLIARGTRFEQAYCPYPLCAPVTRLLLDRPPAPSDRGDRQRQPQPPAGYGDAGRTVQPGRL
ncbi:sulfatase-like hydrolase/transferase [Edwardsiella ictaluri]